MIACWTDRVGPNGTIATVANYPSVVASAGVATVSTHSDTGHDVPGGAGPAVTMEVASRLGSQTAIGGRFAWVDFRGDYETGRTGNVITHQAQVDAFDVQGSVIHDLAGVAWVGIAAGLRYDRSSDDTGSSFAPGFGGSLSFGFGDSLGVEVSLSIGSTSAWLYSAAGFAVAYRYR